MTVERYLMEAQKSSPVYVEDVFSTYLYTGNGGVQSIVNNINLSGKGGMVWIKGRSGTYSSNNHALGNTVIGAKKMLSSNTTGAQVSDDDFWAFNADGFSVADSVSKLTNGNGTDYVSWTFRKQTKFFDIVTYTGTGSARTISHNLGSTPGMIIVKRTDTTANWAVYHSNLTSASYYMRLNLFNTETLDTTVWNATAPTSSVFSVGTSTLTNANTGTYVAYIFASDAGGFGLSGSDSVIKCGSFTTNASNQADINLGWEPQFVLIRPRNVNDNWRMTDIMRGWALTGESILRANLADAELTGVGPYWWPTSTGFSINGGFLNANGAYIYLAIRRGPMKTPTSGTSVYSPIATSSSVTTQQTTNFAVDLQVGSYRTGTGLNQNFNDRLRGISTNNAGFGNYLISSSTNAEAGTNATTLYWGNTGFQISNYFSGGQQIYWNFARAPGFFDIVCYTGTGVATTVTHNLGVAPELMIIKMRSAGENWIVYSAALGASQMLYMDLANAKAATSINFNNTSPTASVFSVGASYSTNYSGYTYVAYLFATLSGVSKVGSYTGTGAAQNIDCGFAAGARFVMIKRTDATGNWYVYDSARGINASGINDPYLLINSTGAEVTNTDYLGTYSSGFALTSTAPAAMNASGGTFIFLAIA